MTTSGSCELFRFARARGQKHSRDSITSGWKTACAVFVLCAATAIASPAQTFRTLANFNGSNGSGPSGSLVHGLDGNFYGTTDGSGAYGHGTVFKMTRGGLLTTLYSFCAPTNCTDGSTPYAGLVQGTDGNFYGTTAGGGAYCAYSGCGTIFKITPSGTLTTLHSFNSTDGAYPAAALVQATDGNFYGTTQNGGNAGCEGGCGTVFKITPGGALTTLYSFNGADGSAPWAGLVQGTDGSFYGTTVSGGETAQQCLSSIPGCGTLFRITPAGTLTTLHKFNGADGWGPYGGLVQGTDGSFYGTTGYGGAYNPAGTVFKITATGELTVLHSFGGEMEGVTPFSGLVQGTDGNFYGTADAEGYAYGTVFKITPSGTLTTLHMFGWPDGAYPYEGLVQATTLRGVHASFTVVDDQTVTTTVPTGATTGKIRIAGPGGAATSATNFTVD